MVEAETFCQEKDVSRMFGERLCWVPASYTCEKCGKKVCGAHKRDLPDDTLVCVSCAEAMRKP